MKSKNKNKEKKLTQNQDQLDILKFENLNLKKELALARKQIESIEIANSVNLAEGCYEETILSLVCLNDIQNSEGNVSFKRVYDIFPEDGFIQEFIVDSRQNRTFENRVTIYVSKSKMNFTPENNQLYFCRWYSEANMNNPVVDYVIADVDNKTQPIYIIEDFSELDRDQVVSSLRNGAHFQRYPRMLIRFRSNNEVERFKAIYCRKQDFEQDGRNLRLKDLINELPVFQVHIENVYNFYGTRFLAFYNPGIPIEFIEIYSKEEVVRSMFLLRASLSAKNSGALNKSEKQLLSEFVDNVALKLTADDVQKCFSISDQEARDLLEKVITQIRRSISGDDLDQLTVMK